VAVFVDLARKTETIQRQAALLREAERREHEKQIDDALAFSHAVSHDLRAPLRHIQSFSEILVESYGAALDDNGRDYLRRLSGAARKMMSLIDAMLQLSQATRGGLHRELIDLSKIAGSIEQDLRRAEPGRRVEFAIEPGVEASGDPDLLRLGLENLINNAWKYTRKNERARIEFGRTRRDGELVYFVKDNGVGFNMAFAGKLFTPFQRLHARSEFEGTGIGLATVKRVIARHGGSIGAESAVDKGATFYFTLPASKP
jgi:light-regulated signal transduction histidine kinase (bacteriophytochrome)